MYHLCKPVDDNEGRIITCVFLIGKHRQSYTSCDLCKPANDNEDHIVTGKLPISRYIKSHPSYDSCPSNQ